MIAFGASESKWIKFVVALVLRVSLSWLRLAHVDSKKRKICPLFNTHRGCTKKEGDCLKRMRHSCNFIDRQGKVCRGAHRTARPQSDLMPPSAGNRDSAFCLCQQADGAQRVPPLQPADHHQEISRDIKDANSGSSRVSSFQT